MTPQEIKKLAEELARHQSSHQARPGAAMVGQPRERLRALVQNGLLGAGDEAEAAIRALGGEQYGDALADSRDKLEAYRTARPNEAMAYEIAGLAIPSLAIGAMTGGTGALGLGPTLGRMALGGAAEGATYAFNAGEGGFFNRATETPSGAVLGAAGGALGGVAAFGAGKGAQAFLDFARRQLGPRAAKTVERELRKQVDRSGMTMQEVIDNLVNGKLLAENMTLATVARAYGARSSAADRFLREVYETRPELLRKETMEYLDGALSGAADPNVIRAQQAGTDAAKRQQSAAYEAAFDAMPEVPPEVEAALSDALKRRPQAAKDAGELYRARTGEAPYFSVTDNGEVVFARTPSLREAEMIRRAMSNQSQKLRVAGSGEVGRAVKDIEGDLRGAIDAASQPLAGTRSEWATIERNADAFEVGRKALARSPDEVEIEFDNAVRDGTESAYRAGVLAALKSRAATGSGKSLPRNLLSEERKEGQILRKVFPEDDLPKALKLLDRAAGAQDAANTILGGSPTAITQGRVLEQSASATNDAVAAFSGSLPAMLRLAGTVVRMSKPELTPKQAEQAAKLMVESDPHTVARALTDRTALDALHRLVDKTTNLGTRASIHTGAAGGGLLASQ